MSKLLHEERLFDPDSQIRKIAIELYQGIKDLPIVSPHGHTDPKWFAENKPFPDPTELLIIPDHYVFRMLYSQGIALESLGIPTVDGSPVEKDHRKIWQIFADNFYLFAGTPSNTWLTHAFETVFGIQEKLTSDSAMHIYDEMDEKLKSPEFLPRALYNRFNIEVLSTTDAAPDTLEYHQAIKDSDWEGRVIPCFRPDSVTNLIFPNWQNQIDALSNISGIEVKSYKSFIEALENRRAFYKEVGATSTDQGVYSPQTHRLTDSHAEAIFKKALKGEATPEDADTFTAHMLMEMARMSTEDGLVMQIHPGSDRNHNSVIFNKFGLDKGCDIPVQTEYTHNLKELLNEYGNDPNFTCIVFTMDETVYSRELAPLAGHYPAMKLGPSWWFHDSPEGMTRFRQQATETAGFYNTVGFNDDTRAFPSIPARHDVARRMDCNFLGSLVAKHMIDMETAKKLAEDLTYNLVKNAYKL